MGARSVSPGGALLRSSRLFSIPKPLVDPSSTNVLLATHRSDTMTKNRPQYQSITSPLASREKGDWGIKRPFPLRSTLATSTPLIRVKAVDTVENVTDFESAASHSLSLEKFQELRIAMTLPQSSEFTTDRRSRPDSSVFEEGLDITDVRAGEKEDKRWKFRGPWLARMTEGAFLTYLKNDVRPMRQEFRKVVRSALAQDLTSRQNNLAMEAGTTAPPPVEQQHITDAQVSDHLRTLRNDRVKLYALVSKFLDLAPLGKPANFLRSIWHSTADTSDVAESPYGKTGPPPSHPSAGIGYLRTAAVMENHPIYGPQERRTPVLSRVLSPKQGSVNARLGVAGFVARTPAGDNDFNSRYHAKKGPSKLLSGISHLDITTRGGAKAWVEADSASIDPSGSVVLTVKETKPDAQAIARESRGSGSVYHTRPTRRYAPADASSVAAEEAQLFRSRMGRIEREVLSDKEDTEESQVMSSAEAYGLGPTREDNPTQEDKP